MSMLKLQPHRRERLGDQLYGQILEQIVAGTLKEGDRLPSEKEICQSFQVSRPVVREALMRLQADGLVIARQGSGTFVQKRPPQGLIRFAPAGDIASYLRSFEVRLALESEAAAMAARRHTPADLSRMKDALGDMGACFADGSLAASADFAFHRAVAIASGNDMFPFLLETIQGVVANAMTVALSITQEGSQERAARVLDEHQRIYDAIAMGDAEAAHLAMRYHIGRARQRVTDHERDA